MIYKTWSDEFQFNDYVQVTSVLLPDSETKGRLVQVRKNRGAFGSDIYLVRLPTGVLRTFENVGLKKLHDLDILLLKFKKDFEDSSTREYTIAKEFPETGFIIENPQQPSAPPSAFGIILKEADKTTNIIVKG